MATNQTKHFGRPDQALVDWLLDSDPAIRWQVMRDLTDQPDAAVAAERSLVATEGWGAQLLARQKPDGTWGNKVSTANWETTLYTLLLLRDFGLDPSSEQARAAVSLVRDKFTWGPDFGNTTFFEGEVEPCINGGTLAVGGYFGEANDQLLERLLGEQLEDGGWNCDAERGSVRSSFHTTICVLEGLLEYEKAKGATVAVTDARRRAHNYLLERHMFRKLSSGEVVDPDWTQFSFPTTWHYDVLRGLDYLRAAGVEPDERVDEAIRLVTKQQDQHGRWLLHNRHADPVGLEMEGEEGTASRWNTLRALRVLDWYEASGRRLRAEDGSHSLPPAQ